MPYYYYLKLSIFTFNLLVMVHHDFPFIATVYKINQVYNVHISIEKCGIKNASIQILEKALEITSIKQKAVNSQN